MRKIIVINISDMKITPTTDTIQSGYADENTTQVVTNISSSLLFNNGLNINAGGNVDTSKNTTDVNAIVTHVHTDINPKEIL